MPKFTKSKSVKEVIETNLAKYTDHKYLLKSKKCTGINNFEGTCWLNAVSQFLSVVTDDLRFDTRAFADKYCPWKKDIYEGGNFYDYLNMYIKFVTDLQSRYINLITIKFNKADWDLYSKIAKDSGNSLSDVHVEIYPQYILYIYNHKIFRAHVNNYHDYDDHNITYVGQSYVKSGIDIYVDDLLISQNDQGYVPVAAIFQTFDHVFTIKICDSELYIFDDNHVEKIHDVNLEYIISHPDSALITDYLKREYTFANCVGIMFEKK